MPDSSTLALVGGPPAVRAGLHRPSPRHGWPERFALWRAASSSPRDLADPDSRWVTRFERAVADYHGVPHAVALANSTDALWAALVCDGVKPGDSVIVSELAGPAAHAVVMAGARPIFCDVTPTGQLDANRLNELIDDTTTAVLVTHANGQPADLKQIHDIVDPAAVTLIEDATQAFGAVYDGRPVGTHSTAGIVSAHADSPLAAGSGAMVITRDEHLARAIRRARQLGIDWVRPGAGQIASNWPRSFGHNSTMSPLDAALGLAKLPRLNTAVERAQRNASELARGLRHLPVLLPLVADGRGTHHLFPIRLDVGMLGWHGPVVELRDRLVHALRAEGVHAGMLPWPPLSRLPMHRADAPGRVRAAESGERPFAPWDGSRCPTANQLFEDTIVLGGWPFPLQAQTTGLMRRYVDAFRKVIAHLDVLADLDLDPLQPVPPIPSIDLATAPLQEGPETC